MYLDRKQRSQILTGAVVMTVGILFLVDQISASWRYGLHFGGLWPVILIVLGVGRFLLPDEAKNEKRSSGVWLIFVGVIFLMNSFHIMSLRQSWPLFIVLTGVSIMLSEPKQKPGGQP